MSHTIHTCGMELKKHLEVRAFFVWNITKKYAKHDRIMGETKTNNVMQDYSLILKEGEMFYLEHDKITLSELKEALSVFVASGRLPDCYWEEIKSYHATNYSSIYNLTDRALSYFYPDSCIVVKPSKSFLEWIINNMKS